MKNQTAITQETIDKFKQYINTYKLKHACGHQFTFIEDMLYGLGIAVDPEEFQYFNGFQKFKARLRKDHLEED